MIVVDREELVLLGDARKLFPQRPSKETLWRWALGRGLMGVRLESVLIGSHRYTTKQAVQRFIARVNSRDAERRAREQAVLAPPAAAETRAAESGRAMDIALARQRLSAAGLL